jgi:hypothetical protein
MYTLSDTVNKIQTLTKIVYIHNMDLYLQHTKNSKIIHKYSLRKRIFEVICVLKVKITENRKCIKMKNTSVFDEQVS